MAKKKASKKPKANKPFIIRGLSLDGMLKEVTGGHKIHLRKNGEYVIDGSTVSHEAVVMALNEYLCKAVSGTVVSVGPFKKAYIAIPPSYDVGFPGDVIKGKDLNSAVNKLVKKYGEEK